MTSGISTTVNPSASFNGAAPHQSSGIIDDIGGTVVPAIRGAFSYAADGIGDFARIIK